MHCVEMEVHVAQLESHESEKHRSYILLKPDLQLPHTVPLMQLAQPFVQVIQDLEVSSA